MEKELLLKRAVPARAPMQLAAAAWQVCNWLPTMAIAPLSFVWKRTPNGATVAPIADVVRPTSARADTATRRAATHDQTRRFTCTPRSLVPQTYGAEPDK
ncbi:hypothetical protein ASC59_14600 [Leifsonia sp. Root1293]|nr:hypothetical protein ASC59_14600 [Leifsonia sp. Root1293]KRA09004.1 hypothetical protein ASD61_14595 [Leifsonia sp. Root60]